jgi:hypothetical protein
MRGAQGGSFELTKGEITNEMEIKGWFIGRNLVTRQPIEASTILMKDGVMACNK